MVDPQKTFVHVMSLVLNYLLSAENIRTGKYAYLSQSHNPCFISAISLRGHPGVCKHYRAT